MRNIKLFKRKSRGRKELLGIFTEDTFDSYEPDNNDDEDFDYEIEVIPDDDDWDTYYSDEDDVLPGCQACGNPVYPECKWSCPMFDE